MPLAEIRAFLAAPSDVVLERYERSLADELVDRRRILRYLRKRLKEAPMFDVQTKQMDELRFASKTKRVRVAELDPFIESSISELRDEHDAAHEDLRTGPELRDLWEQVTCRDEHYLLAHVWTF